MAGQWCREGACGYCWLFCGYPLIPRQHIFIRVSQRRASPINQEWNNLGTLTLKMVSVQYRVQLSLTGIPYIVLPNELARIVWQSPHP